MTETLQSLTSAELCTVVKCLCEYQSELPVPESDRDVWDAKKLEHAIQKLEMVYGIIRDGDRECFMTVQD